MIISPDVKNTQGRKNFEFHRLPILATICYSGSDLLHITEKDQMVLSVTCQSGILLQLELESIAIFTGGSSVCLGWQQLDRKTVSEVEESAGSRVRYAGRTEERIAACHKEEM